MLILADTDALRVDLDQLRQRILQPSSQRHRAASRHIQIRIFLCRQFGGGVDRRARFVDDRILDIVTILFNEVCDHFFGLARGRSVANHDDVRMELFDNLFECRLGTRDILLRLGRINRRVCLELACFIEHRHLAAGPIARVDRDDLLAPHRRRHQQALRILRENLDCLRLRAFRQHIAHLTLDGRCHQPFVGIGNGALQHLIKDAFFVSDDGFRDQFVDLLGL